MKPPICHHHQTISAEYLDGPLKGAKLEPVDLGTSFTDTLYRGMVVLMKPKVPPKLSSMVRRAPEMVDTHVWLCPTCLRLTMTAEGPDDATDES